MADYFEKALPKAILFYKKVATDKEFAKDILNEIKNVADTDQFVEYYKNFTLEQFMADFKALLSVNDDNNSQILYHSKRSEESQKNLQNINSQTSQNTPKEELSFTEKLLLKDFAHKLYGVKMPETKQRIGIDAATQCKISFLLGDISKHKRQIVQKFDEKTWQETFENFQKTNDLKVFENALKSQIPTQNFNKNINLQISNENANLKNSRHSELSQESEESHKNLQNSAKNTENLQIPNPQDLGNDNKM